MSIKQVKLTLAKFKDILFESIIVSERTIEVGTLVLKLASGEKEYPIFKNDSSYKLIMGVDRFSTSWKNEKILSAKIIGIPEFAGNIKTQIDTSKPHVKFIFINKYGKIKSMNGTKGSATGGQSDGEAAEPLVAYLYNNIGKDKRSFNFSDKWQESSEKIAEFIDKNWNHNKYFAAHVNGRDLDNVPGEVKKIASIFYSKYEAAKAFGFKADIFKDLYIGAKDNWNKADIVLVKNGFNIDRYKKYITNGSTLNSVLVELSRGPNPKIVPISLKGVNPNKPLHNVPEGFDSADEERKTSTAVRLILPKKFQPNSNNGSCYIEDDNGRLIQFRVQTPAESDNLSIEVSLGANARGGKGITKIKQDLELSGKSWYDKSYSESEVIDFFKTVFKSSSNELVHLSSLTDKNDTNPWWNRTCFRGLINLYYIYAKKYSANSATDFFDWIYDKSSLGTGAFYLIYN